ncbi:hypothetical protein FOCC_FOCC007377 [Frankliniella occidentalis]|uniref:Protein tipE n=1 Tax=Frankliniella occidentalis TaxID=133901 RepID=A0A6J1S0X8_FRAOC|nr:protein tipE [Frankliniella occidentalis]XP_052124409.1 protein tipE [Frankliniella occidentalis]KAE8745858.1 hypothetical protein FOCC_FOCC007377 [Frankliniella occidentalis]
MDSDESTIIMGAEVGPGGRSREGSLMLGGLGRSPSGSAHTLGSLGGLGGGGLGGSGVQFMGGMASLVERAKFYTSLCLGTTAILSVFAFLFLIPFVVDPAISSILANYEREAVTCVATDHVYTEGLTNCSWASCREGCTTATPRCHQIRVNYSHVPYHTWALTQDRASLQWAVTETRFLVNTEGCGYPPRVNCSEFAKQYGYSRLGVPFPCYYSRAYPQIVVARYSWEETLRHLLLSLIVPNVLFGVSVGVLCYWYCCQGSQDTVSYVEKFSTKDDDEDPDEDFDEEEEY